MRKRRLFGALIFAIPAALAVATIAVAGDGDRRNLRAASLQGYQEAPPISTTGTGSFEATIEGNGNTINYRLTYGTLDPAGTVTQAHIHFGQRDVSGGISVWLCSNLTTPPTPAAPNAPPACLQPTGSGTVTVDGTFTSAHVVGPGGQGIDAGQFDELVRALRAGMTYANVHTTRFPGGEIRGQINDRGRGDNDRGNDAGDDD